MENRTLMEIRNHYERIVSDWNGEDSRFTSGGTIYTEEDAHVAEEIVEKISAILELMGSVPSPY